MERAGVDQSRCAGPAQRLSTTTMTTTAKSSRGCWSWYGGLSVPANSPPVVVTSDPFGGGGCVAVDRITEAAGTAAVSVHALRGPLLLSPPSPSLRLTLGIPTPAAVPTVRLPRALDAAPAAAVAVAAVAVAVADGVRFSTLTGTMTAMGEAGAPTPADSDGDTCEQYSIGLLGFGCDAVTDDGWCCGDGVADEAPLTSSASLR